MTEQAMSNLSDARQIEQDARAALDVAENNLQEAIGVITTATRNVVDAVNTYRLAIEVVRMIAETESKNV